MISDILQFAENILNWKDSQHKSQRCQFDVDDSEMARSLNVGFGESFWLSFELSLAFRIWQLLSAMNASWTLA
jgi:hypothetical protein